MSSTSEAPLPRNRVRAPVPDSEKITIPKRTPNKKAFGFKNKRTKLEKTKKSTQAPKVRSVIKPEDFTIGSIALCSVRAIQDELMFLALPGGAHGIIVLTEVNDHFLKTIQKSMENQAIEPPSVEDFFKPGDFLEAVVISQSTHPVELSIKPTLVNTGIKPEIGAVFFGAVCSKEDHGYLIDLGNDNVKGFLEFGEEKFVIGQPLYVQITKTPSPSIVTVERYQQDHFFPSYKPEKDILFDDLRPHSILSAIPITNEKSGAVSSLVADSFNAVASKFSWPSGLSIGTSTLCRPLLIDPTSKAVWISYIPSIVEGISPLCYEQPIGAFIDSTVKRIRLGIGIECTDDGDQQRIFIDFKTTKSDVALAVNDKHRVRITERRALDDLLMATDDAEIMELKVFCSNDVAVGEQYEGTVSHVHPKHGIFVKLSPFFTALCPLQFADDSLTVKKGDTVKCVVTSIQNEQASIALKSKFVNSKLPKILNLDDAKALMAQKEFTHSLVLFARRGGIIVEMYNHLTAMVPINYLPLEKGQDVTKLYQRGHVVKVKVVSIDGDKINCAVTADDEQILTFGKSINCVVDTFTEQDVVVTLPAKYGECKGIIQATHFADDPKLSLFIRDSMRIGQKIHDCILVRLPGVSTPAILTKKRCFRENVQEIPHCSDDIKEGQSYFGYVSGVQTFGSYVSFFGRASGLAHNKIMKGGDSVHVFVDKLNNGKGSFLIESNNGESFKYLQYFMSDCAHFKKPGKINEEFEVQSEPLEKEDHFVYQVNDDWKALSKQAAKVGDKLRIVYVDIISNTLVLDAISEQHEQLEEGATIEAEVLAVCAPIIVCKAGNAILLAPMYNFNNHTEHDINETIEVIVGPYQEKGDLYFANPTFLAKSDADGNKVSGVITALRGAYCTVELADKRTAKMHLAQVPDPQVGQKVEGKLIVRNVSLKIVNPESPQKLKDFKIGQEVQGIATAVYPQKIKLSLSPSVEGVIHPLHLTLADHDVPAHLTKHYTRNQIICGHVIDIHKGKVIVSCIDPNATKVVGKIIRIKQGDHALVSLGFNDTRLLDITDVCDELVFNPLNRYKLGDLIDVVVVDKNHLSAKVSSFEGTEQKVVVKEGEILTGYVNHHTESAFLVRLTRGVTGKCPYSNVTDHFIKNPEFLYPDGSVVHVKVMSIKGKVITLSMKHSDLEGGVLDFEAVEVGHQYDGYVTGSNPKFGVFVQLRDFALKVSGLVHRSTLESPPGEWDTLTRKRVVVECTEKDEAKRKINLKIIEIKSDESLGESDEALDEPDVLDQIELNQETLEWEDEKEEEEQKEEIKPRRKQTENEITELEAKRLNPTMPKTADEFVSHLEQNPGASVIWAKFIDFYFQKNEIELAKQTADTAIAKLPAGPEKQNILTIKLNLLIMTENDRTFKEVIQKAVQDAVSFSDDPERVWLHFGTFVAENRPGKTKMAWDMILNHGKTAKVWSTYLNTYMDADQIEDGKDFTGKEKADFLNRIYSSALDSAKSKDQKINTEQKRTTENQTHQHESELRCSFGAVYFEHGNLERGRDEFKFALRYKNEVKYWRQLIELEKKYGEENQVRQDYRDVTATNLNPSTMRGILKSWREWEKLHGDDPDRQKEIIEIAKAYQARQK